MMAEAVPANGGAPADVGTSHSAAQREHLRVVIVSAGVGQPSSTSLLADRYEAAIRASAGDRGLAIAVTRVELRPLASDLANAAVSGLVPPALQRAIQAIDMADAVVAASPIYKASYSGLFKLFVDLLPNDTMIGTPVALAATGGTARHSLVVDTDMRSLFAYLRALSVPTSVFAGPESWGEDGNALTSRVSRAADELVTLAAGDAAHELGARTARARVTDGGVHEQREQSVDPNRPDQPILLDTDLMRLATGGESPGKPDTSGPH